MTAGDEVLTFSPVEWAVLVASAAVVGFSKTGISGVAALAVAGFAIVLPARESTGALLPLLIAGDVTAIAVYRRHADWNLLRRVLPGVLPGLLLGTVFLAFASDTVVRVLIAGVLVALLVGNVSRTSKPRAHESSPPVVAGLFGLGAGSQP